VSILRMRCEMPKAGTDRAPRRINPGDQQQPQCADDVFIGQRLSIDLRPQQIGD
jgi:hypothetical protein